MWLFRKRRQAANEEDTDADLERSRQTREQLDRFVAEAQRYANRLEARLNKTDGRRMGRA